MVRNFIYLFICLVKTFRTMLTWTSQPPRTMPSLLIETDRIRSRDSDNLCSADDKQTRSGHGSHGRVFNKWSAGNSSCRRFLAESRTLKPRRGNDAPNPPDSVLPNEVFSSLVDLPCQSRVPLGTHVGNSVGPVTLSRHQSCLVLRTDSPSKDFQNYSDQTSHVIHVLRAVGPSIFMSRDRIQQKYVHIYIYVYDPESWTINN